MTFPWREPGGDAVTVRVLTRTRERGALDRNSFDHHVWKPALRDAGIAEPERADWFHALRHFYVSVLLDGGESIKAPEYLGLRSRLAERTRRAVGLAPWTAKTRPPRSPAGMPGLHRLTA
jgi:hypothetical protein